MTDKSEEGSFYRTKSEEKEGSLEERGNGSSFSELSMEVIPGVDLDREGLFTARIEATSSGCLGRGRFRGWKVGLILWYKTKWENIKKN